MRPIKYRAWDKENKKMIYGGQVHFSTPLSLDVFEFHKTSVHTYPFTQHVLMQYTGLFDNQGKEIYEGDILKNELYQKCEVKWYKELAKWDIQFGINEIIGNIYENPELIK